MFPLTGPQKLKLQQVKTRFFHIFFSLTSISHQSRPRAAQSSAPSHPQPSPHRCGPGTACEAHTGLLGNINSKTLLKKLLKKVFIEKTFIEKVVHETHAKRKNIRWVCCIFILNNIKD